MTSLLLSVFSVSGRNCCREEAGTDDLERRERRGRAAEDHTYGARGIVR